MRQIHTHREGDIMGDTRAFGVSLNDAIDGDDSFLFALGKDNTFCDGTLNNDGDYDECGEGIYYNHDTESLIFVPSGSLAITSVNDLLTGGEANLLQNKINGVVSFAEGSLWTLDQGLINRLIGGTNRLRNLYYANHQGKELFAFIEEKQFVLDEDFNSLYLSPLDYLGLSFKDFRVSDILGADACILVQNLVTGLDSVCVHQDDDMDYIVIYDTNLEDVSLLWRDLTSKLRHQ